METWWEFTRLFISQDCPWWIWAEHCGVIQSKLQTGAHLKKSISWISWCWFHWYILKGQLLLVILSFKSTANVKTLRMIVKTCRSTGYKSKPKRFPSVHVRFVVLREKKEGPSPCDDISNISIRQKRIKWSNCNHMLLTRSARTAVSR